MALQSKNVVIMEVNGAKTATNSKWGRKNVNLILLKNKKCIKANVFPNLGHAQDCDKSKKKSSPQSLFILKISNFVCFFPKISDIIYELGN